MFIFTFRAGEEKMSLEPATTAKVSFKTSKGSIVIELWAQECPISSKKFLNDCQLGKFNGLKFSKIIPKFSIQLDPTDGPAHSLKPEVHPRLRFNRRGLVGLDGSSVFITLGESAQLNNKKTLLGKVVNDTIFTVLKISEGQLEADGAPLYRVQILETEVIIPFFTDLLSPVASAAASVAGAEKADRKKKPKKKKVVLKFGEEEDEQEELEVKMKSAHEVLDELKPKPKKEAKVEHITEEQPAEEEKVNQPAEEEKVNQPAKEEKANQPAEEEKPNEPVEKDNSAEMKQEQQGKQETPKPREQSTLDLLAAFKSKLNSGNELFSHKLHFKPADGDAEEDTLVTIDSKKHKLTTASENTIKKPHH